MLLVVAAYEPELAGLPPTVTRRAIGIGAVEAAAGMATALAELKPGAVLVVGTCGAFAPVGAGPGLAVGEVVVVESAHWATNPSVVVPEVVTTVAQGHEALLTQTEGALGAKRVIAACGDGVTVDDEVARKVARATNAQVEHMETFAVYRACARLNVPVCAVLVVANRVGAGAREEWKANAPAVEAALVERLGRWLGAGRAP